MVEAGNLTLPPAPAEGRHGMSSHQLSPRVLAGGAIIAALGLIALGAASAQLAWHPPSLDYFLLAGLTILISQWAVRIPGSPSAISASETLTFFAILHYGSPAATLIAALDGLLASRLLIGRSLSRYKVIFNVGLLSLSAYVAGIVYEQTPWLLDQFTYLAPDSGAHQVVPVIAMALAHYLTNLGLMSVVTSLSEKKPLIETWRHQYLWVSTSYFAAASTAVFIQILVKQVGLYALTLSAPILVVLYLAYRSYSEHIEASRRSAEAAHRHAEEMAALHLRTIEALAIAIDAKDQITHDHVQRVRIYAEGLARVFGLSPPEMKALHAAALLHDIGKLAVPDYILNKPGRLTAAEFEKMKVHTIIGASILECVGFPYPLVPIVKHHHERWDGSGYPDGLKGEQIPITARILAVVDCFDAVREDRQYRKGLTREQAINLLLQERGKCYDPKVVDAFLAHLPEFEKQIAQLRARTIPSINISTESEAMKVARPAAGLAKDSSPLHYLGEIRAAHQEVFELFDLAQSLSSTLDINRTCALLTEKLARLVPIDTCAIYLKDEGQDSAYVAYAAGRYAERLLGHKAVLGHGITGYVLATGTPFHEATDPALELGGLGQEVQRAFRAIAAYPLAKNDKIIGAMTLLSSQLERYSPEQLRIIERVAPLAADALRNAIVYQRTEACALTDVLTGLPNSRALAEAFERDRSRAERYGGTLVLLMMDLDGFKQINDLFGHQVGDRVLHDIAHCLKQEFRAGDTLIRYAGDEFIALLNLSGERATEELIHRIQNRIDSYRHFVRDHEAQVGISIGYAVYGKDGQRLEELMQVADSDMYRNKYERKRRLRRWSDNPQSLLHPHYAQEPTVVVR
jgi:diguanylate cyclase (GGDEF)-like protein/putative nucleotidyltransferase with HDIG domain